MDCDTGRLTGYRDGALCSEEAAAMEEHLAICDDCRAELGRLARRSEALAASLAALDPAPGLAPDSAYALAALRQATGSTSLGPTPVGPTPVGPTPVGPTPLSLRLPSYKWTIIRRLNMQGTSSTSRRAPRLVRLAGAGAAALMLVGAVFSFAPARQAAADFLSIFRVETFEVVPIDDEQQARLESFGEILESDQLLQPEFISEPSEPVAVEDVSEASRIAGFDVRTLPDLPEGVELLGMEVATGPHMRFEVDRDVAAAALAMAGMPHIDLPSVQTLTLEADVPAVVYQEYMVGGQEFTFVQSPDPSVVLPPGVPPEALGKAYLQFLGLPAENAGRLAAEIDWTSTFVLPMPAGEATYKEVQVGGAPALLLRSHAGPYSDRGAMLLWQKDGVVFAAGGSDLAVSLLIRAAEALE